MQASKPYYFYLWVHRFVDDQDQIIARTCFGITKNVDDRRNGYEGHVGHTVQFARVWSGPERLIRELETRVKTDFTEYLVRGHRNFQYEWIKEDIKFNDIVKYVEWEVGNFIGVQSLQL